MTASEVEVTLESGRGGHGMRIQWSHAVDVEGGGCTIEGKREREREGAIDPWPSDADTAASASIRASAGASDAREIGRAHV